MTVLIVAAFGLAVGLGAQSLLIAVHPNSAASTSTMRSRAV